MEGRRLILVRYRRTDRQKDVMVWVSTLYSLCLLLSVFSVSSLLFPVLFLKVFFKVQKEYKMGELI